MSRLARKLITIPAGVTVAVSAGSVSAKGTKGELTVRIPDGIAVAQEPGGVRVTMERDDAQTRADVGTTWSHITNAVEGVHTGFEKSLEIEGVGYRAQLEGKTLVLSLGFVNPVRYEAPAGVTMSVEKNVIKVAGVSKEAVGQAAADIRAFKKPEPYKGKGIHYVGEVIRRKAGKKAATGTAA
jgi:large subunit ribosomal protein L6